jgi:uncharacterized membrane protein
MNKSVFGLQENLAAALAYLFGFVSGIVVLVLEKSNKTVRFAALQSTIFFLVTFLLLSVLGFLSNIWLVGWIFGMVSWVLRLLTFGVWLWLFISALMGRAKDTKIPIIGEVIWEHDNK